MRQNRAVKFAGPDGDTPLKYLSVHRYYITRFWEKLNPMFTASYRLSTLFRRDL